MGRPTKLTAETQQRICDAIRAGNYYEAAAAYAGIEYFTFRRWMERGQAAKSGPFREFCEAVSKAEADAEVRIVAQWQQQIPENWQAARDFLARRHPERWGPKEKREVSGPEGGPIEHKDVGASDEARINRIMAIIDAARKRGTGLADAESAGAGSDEARQ